MPSDHAESSSLAARGVVTKGSIRRIVHVDMDAFYASVEQRDGPSFAAGRSRSAVPAIARRGRRRQLRGAAVRRALRDADEPGGSSLSRSRDRATGLRQSIARSLSRCSRSAARSPRSSSRSRSTRRTSTSPRTPGASRSESRWRSGSSRDPREHRPHGFGRGRPEQVPGQDRLRMAQARRPDRGGSGKDRVVPAAAPRRRAVGRRPGDREAAACARHRARWSTCAPPIPSSCAGPSAA